MRLEIDYAAHPAFKAITPARADCPAAGRYFAAADAVWAELISADRLPADGAGAEFDRRTQSLLSELKQALAEQAIPSDYLPHVSAALDKSHRAIREEITHVIQGRLFRRSRDPLAGRICEELHHSGAAAIRMDPDMRRSIAESLQPYMKQVDAQRDSGTGARCFVTVPAHGAHWRLLKHFVREQRVEDAISAYAGFPLELQGYALTLSHPGETWFKICYDDLGLSAPQTVQQHFDLDNLSAKSMFYLNDVDLDSGPFAYTPQTKGMLRWRSQTSFFKYLDYANNDFAVERGTPGTIYNRPLFIDAGLRKAFATLPKDLQGTSCPGDDVLDGSELSGVLLHGERALTSEDGDLMLFAGGEVLHRGGVARSGQRYALQMIYLRPPSFTQKVIGWPRRFARHVKYRLQRV